MDKEKLVALTSKAGKKSSSKLSPEERSARAEKAALARWSASPTAQPEDLEP